MIRWLELDLQLAILQILLDARIRKPKSGGASASFITNQLDAEPAQVNEALSFLLDANRIDRGERLYSITAHGIEHLYVCLSGSLLALPPFCAGVLKVLCLKESVTVVALVEAIKPTSLEEIELALWYLREKGYLDIDDRRLVLNEDGLDFVKGLPNFPPPEPPHP
ncbi:hypothetical protein KF728_07190 [Candidatus Obscuribacterales bacterium]|nr:hypothetical protein [Candidatus Obscuribacterales bacterium]